MKIPFLDLKQQHRSLQHLIMPLWEDLLNEAAFIGGNHVESFETEFAAACNASHCVAVSNGTVALQFIFEALNVKPGDEVIVPCNTFIATAEAVTSAGGRPVFVDVREDTANIDPECVQTAITGRTRGIVPVHLYGAPADMDPLLEIARRHNLWIVEDAAQAHLARYNGLCVGSFGVAAGFSFYPGKNLGACGDAGAVVTNDADLAERVRKLRDHGSSRKYIHEFEGHNGRCDALQAAALRVKLEHLPAWNEQRRALARHYIESLEGATGLCLPHVPPECLPVWHLFVVRVKNRDHVRAQLEESGVATGLHYPLPLHLQLAYAHLNYAQGSFPVAERWARELVSLPMFPEMSLEQVEYVCNCLKHAVADAAAPMAVS